MRIDHDVSSWTSGAERAAIRGTAVPVLPAGRAVEALFAPGTFRASGVVLIFLSVGSYGRKRSKTILKNQFNRKLID
jgi:hypothetical protein